MSRKAQRCDGCGKRRVGITVVGGRDLCPSCADPTSFFRFYSPDVDPFGDGGYPLAWSVGVQFPAIKDAARDLWDHRCVRCKHPYRKGEHPLFKEGDGYTSWSSCDGQCDHAGPIRLFDKRHHAEEHVEVDQTERAGDAVQAFAYGDFAIQAKWRVLTVHHLDGNKANCCWWNLAPLCQRCHLTIQRKVQMARIWPWEHSEWFKPFVAGYYAYSYQGRNLTLANVLTEMPQLLQLERMA